jgi:hypothetical protein
VYGEGVMNQANVRKWFWMFNRLPRFDVAYSSGYLNP